MNTSTHSPILDPDSALKFLLALDPTAETFNFRSFHDHTGKGARKHDNVLLADVPRLMEDCAREGRGLFVVVNAGGQRDSEITRVRAVVVDLDRKDFPTSEACDAAMLMIHEGRHLRSDPPAEDWPYSSAVVASGGGGYHVYRLVKDLPLEQFQAVQRAMAAKFGGDTSCTNLSRVMRLPGSLHQKSEPRPVRLMLCKPERRYQLDDMLTRMGMSTDVTSPSKQPEPRCAEDPEDDPVVDYLITHNEHLRHGGRCSRDKPIDVVCPNAAAHAEPDSVSSAVYMPQGFNGKPRAFRCLHGHCADLSLRDFLAHIGFEVDCPTFHSDDGLACRFVASLDGSVIFSRDHFFVWTGAYWRPDEGHVKSKLKTFADKQHRATVREYAVAASMNNDAAKRMLRTATSLLNEQRQTQVLKSVANMVRVSAENLDNAHDQLAVPNGRVDLRTGDLLAADPETYPTFTAGAAYDPAARSPRWDQFLAEIFGNDQAIIDYVQRFAGYGLTGHTREEVMLVGYGSGANGKSVFAEVLRTVLGDYATAADPSLITAASLPAAGATPEAARLCGKRLCLLNESKVGDKLDDGMIKKLVSTEKMVARALYREPFEFFPTAKLFLRTNHRPAIRDTSEGMWRRLHMLPFAAHFPSDRRDAQLLQKLQAEKEGILAWAVRGAVAWYRDGLRPPAIILESTNAFRSDQDTMTEWLSERVEGGGFTSTAVLVDDYVMYAGLRHAPSTTNFANWLKDKGIQPHRRSDGRGFKATLKPRGGDGFDAG